MEDKKTYLFCYMKAEGCPSYSRLMHGEKRRRWLVCGGGGTALSESCNKMNNE